jgi:3'(2'), 5'-bisphosphate nucleotidase
MPEKDSIEVCSDLAHIKLHVHEICAVLIQAGEAIEEYYNNGATVEISYKKDNSPVTTADITSNAIVTNGLKKIFRDIPVLSEESDVLPYSERKNLEYLWLLDPLDGTKEFLKRTGEFSINLALIHRRRSVAGFIYVPISKKLYYAIKGMGAYHVTSEGHQPIQCSKFSLDQEGLRVVVSGSIMDAYTRAEIDRLRNPKKIKLGSALKFLSIASGEADYYPRMIHIMEWDTAAGQIIIEEAGGSLEDAFTGKPLEYNKQSLVNPFFIASGIII